MESGYGKMNSDATINLEKKLSHMLKPVRPDPVFLSSLKNKISKKRSIWVAASKKQIGLLVVGAGLFAGALTLWIVSRVKKVKD
jgi:hypothetical protein